MSPKRAKKAAKRRAAPKKRAAKQRTGKKPVRATSAKNSARRKVVRKPVRKPAAKRTSGRAPARKSARRAAKSARGPKRVIRGRKKSTGRSPAKLRVVRGTAAKKAAPKKSATPKKPASPRHRPFGGAIQGASAKELALFEMVRARVGVQAAIQGMVAASAEVPVGEGKWNSRQMVLHLHYWDREMLPYVEPAWRENRRPPHTHQDILDENDSSQQELGHHDWDEARRLMQQTRETLLETLQSIPEEPAEMWSIEHALGWLIRVFTSHDRHHAAALKEARIRNDGQRGRERE